jgi:hypothetical protein
MDTHNDKRQRLLGRAANIIVKKAEDNDAEKKNVS